MEYQLDSLFVSFQPAVGKGKGASIRMRLAVMEQLANLHDAGDVGLGSLVPVQESVDVQLCTNLQVLDLL